VNPISYNEIVCWSELTGVRPDSIEIQALMALDSAFMAVQADEIKKRGKNG